MGLDVRLDPFLKTRQADPDAVVRSRPVEKVWSDEAREAAAEARRTGSSGKPVEWDGRGDRPEGHVPVDSREALNEDRAAAAERRSEWRGYGVGAAEAAERRSEGRPASPRAGLVGSVAEDHGLRSAGEGKNGAKLYTHPKVGLVGVNPDGSWEAAGDTGSGKGSGAASLESHLRRQGLRPSQAKSAATFSPVGKKAGEIAHPPGPRVIEVAGDQGSIAREHDGPHVPGMTTDKKEEGGCLFSPVKKSGPRVVGA